MMRSISYRDSSIFRKLKSKTSRTTKRGWGLKIQRKASWSDRLPKKFSRTNNSIVTLCKIKRRSIKSVKCTSMLLKRTKIWSTNWVIRETHRKWQMHTKEPKSMEVTFLQHSSLQGNLAKFKLQIDSITLLLKKNKSKSERQLNNNLVGTLWRNKVRLRHHLLYPNSETVLNCKDVTLPDKTMYPWAGTWQLKTGTPAMRANSKRQKSRSILCKARSIRPSRD